MKCPHCGEEISELSQLERDRIKRDLWEQEKHETYESMKNKPWLAVDSHGLLLKGQRAIGRFGVVCWIAAFLAFLLTDDIKWHAIFPVLVLAMWFTSCALNYINVRDHVKWVEEHPEAVQYLPPPRFDCDF